MLRFAYLVTVTKVQAVFGVIILFMFINSIAAYSFSRIFTHSVASSRLLQKRGVIVRLMAKKSKQDIAVRPSIDDIERISRGQAAKKRGVGSRAVPHRLNASERKEWDLAKKRRFLQLRGTGWRRARGDSPLANIYRNYCDAVAVPYISVQRSLGQATIPDTSSDPSDSGDVTGNVDYVTVDFSPLRQVDVSELAQQCIADAKEHFPQSVVSIDDGTDYNQQGWDFMEEAFRTDAIWRLPPCSVTFGFNVRADSKRFAERVAVQFAGGQPLSSSASGGGGAGGAGSGGGGGGGRDGGVDIAGAVSSGDDSYRPERIAEEEEDDGEDELEEVEDEEDDDDEEDDEDN